MADEPAFVEKDMCLSIISSPHKRKCALSDSGNARRSPPKDCVFSGEEELPRGR
jgi:hypothetical protein